MIKILLIILFSITCAAKIVVFEIDTGVQKGAHKQIDDHLPGITNQIDYKDDNNHGTHVAGIILKNVCKEVELQSCSYYFNKKPFDIFTIECLKAALTIKPDVINISWGGPNPIAEEFELLTKLSNNGTKIVVSAGNNNLNLLLGDYYPAKYNIKNLTPVGSLNKNGFKSSFSNYGLLNEVYESGEDIKSTLPNGKYGTMSGTSQATAAHVNKLLLEICKKLENKNN